MTTLAIGTDAILGGHDICLMAVGLQPIGNVVVKDEQSGRFVSLTRLRGFGRAIVSSCGNLVARLRAMGLDVVEAAEGEPVEYERRAAPRRRPAPTARLVAWVALAVVVCRVVPSALSATFAALGDSFARLARWGAGYVRREFVDQWRLLAFVLVPAVVSLAWLTSR